MLELLHSLNKLSDPEKIEKLVSINFSGIPLHIFWKNKKGILLGSNDHQAKTLGFNKGSDIIGLNNFDLAESASATAIQNNDQQIITQGQQKFFFETCTALYGTHWMAMSFKTPWRHQHHKILGMIGLSFLIDNTNRMELLTQLNHQPQNLSETKTLSTNKTHCLTNRQIQCLYYLARGMTLKQIAIALNLAPKTIEHHLEIAKIKLNCYSRYELIEKARQLGFLNEAEY